MATLLKINNEDKKEINVMKMTPEYIQGKLFSFHNAAHKFHLNTKSFAEHSAMNGLYTSLVDFKDEISEKLMGYMNGERIGDISIDKIPNYSTGVSENLANEILIFAKKLNEWAGENEYCDIENIAQELSGEAAKTIYLLTLK